MYTLTIVGLLHFVGSGSNVARGYVAARLLGLRVRILPGHGRLLLVSVVCFQVEVSATG